jgi:hypothetical protein
MDKRYYVPALKRYEPHPPVPMWMNLSNIQLSKKTSQKKETLQFGTIYIMEKTGIDSFTDAGSHRQAPSTAVSLLGR